MNRSDKDWSFEDHGPQVQPELTVVDRLMALGVGLVYLAALALADLIDRGL